VAKTSGIRLSNDSPALTRDRKLNANELSSGLDNLCNLYPSLFISVKLFDKLACFLLFDDRLIFALF